MKTIRIENFSTRKGTFQLHPVNLTIERSEIFAILGRTGSGKTVLLEAIAGMYRGDQGRILFDDTDITTIPPGERQIGLVYQDCSLFPHMKVWENIAYGLKMHRVPKAEQKRRVETFLEMMSITSIRDQYPGTLSGGEKQRTALARALALEPEVLLLDEPFSALDPAMRATLYDNIRAIHDRFRCTIIFVTHDRFRCTIIFVTHDFTEAQLLADRIGILLHGDLMAVSPAQCFLTQHYTPEIEDFLGRGRGS